MKKLPPLDLWYGVRHYVLYPVAGLLPALWAERKVRWTILWTILFVLGYGKFICMVPPARLLASVSALTDTVSYVVTDESHATFRVETNEILMDEEPLTPSEGVGGCRTVIVRPYKGSSVTYNVVGSQIHVVLESSASQKFVGSITLDGSSKDPSRARRSIALMADAGPPKEDQSGRAACPNPALRLPVWGIAEIGEEPRAVTAFAEPRRLLNGKLTVYGQSLSSGQSLLASVWPTRTTLYPVAVVEIPPGGRIAAVSRRPSEEGSRLVAESWWGVVRWNSQENALTTELTTTAQEILIYPAGPLSTAGGRREALTIHADLLSQMFNDPVLQKWNLIAAGIFIVLQLGTALGGLMEGTARSHRRSKRDR